MSIIEFKKKPETNHDLKLIDDVVTALESAIALDSKLPNTMSRPYLSSNSIISLQFEEALINTSKALLFLLKEEIASFKEIKDKDELRNYMVPVESFMNWYNQKDPRSFHATTLVNPEGDFGDRNTQYLFALTSDYKLVIMDIFSEKGNLVSVLMNKFHQDGFELVFGS